MTNTVLLNNVDHHDLRLRTQRSAAWGDGVMLAHAVPAEFRELQAHYPIVFQKSADGTTFHPVALLGFQDGQNLFLDADGWDAGYLPLAIEREPFLIGRDGGELLVHVDLDSPRLSRSDGEPLFLPHGGTTDTLERINSVLLALHEGLQATPAFVAALLAHDLLESFVLDVEQPDGSQQRLAGFYTIAEERLAALDGAALAQLHRAGHLQAVFMAVASLSNLAALIERQNRRLAGGA
ncbi:MAG: peptidase [Burkholderiales bacterium RIFCSPHIGHO2_12_FULL_69_20]|nr:MAG: peptidase [Burkholderiales bacterium RIFCSPHIGHO2_12_FULL_69_20]